MYNFIDVNEASESVMLPSEALKINGEYIENQIEGYRTLSVSGREALSPDVVTNTSGTRDGSMLKSKRFPERIIVVTYQLTAKSNEAFREAYNKLGMILNVEEAELIFADEQDKYFTGTPCIIGSVPPGRNSVVGEFEIVCTDPFKYSVLEYEAVPDLDSHSILINYGGTYKAYPILEATFAKEQDASEDGESVTELTGNGDCGYVAFITEDKKIVQIGDPDETEGDDLYPKSPTLINSSFSTSNGWGSAAKSQWSVNSGMIFPDPDNVPLGGSVGTDIAYTIPNSPAPKSGTIIDVTAKGAPLIRHHVSYKEIDRTSTAVTLSISIGTNLTKSESYYGTGYALTAKITIGGHQTTVSLKKSSDYWRGTAAHNTTLQMTVTGLTASTEYLTCKFQVESTGVAGTAGVVSLNRGFYINKYAVPTVGTYYLAPLDYGTGAHYHGPSITRKIPADKMGDVGAQNFTLSYAHQMSIDNSANAAAQYGRFQVMLVSGSGSSRKLVAGISINKTNYGRTADVRFYVNGEDVLTWKNFDISYNNERFHRNTTTTISKSRDVITFNIGGTVKTFANKDYGPLKVTEVTFAFSKFSTLSPLAYNGLCWAKFVKDNCDTWVDVPNKFSANDVVTADCNTGEICLNGTPTPALGALGNDWEDFCITPGFNQIGAAYSSWATVPPSFKVRYREVFL